LRQKLHHGVGTLDIKVEAGGDDYQLGTLFISGNQRFSGGNAISLGRGGFGKDNAVSGFDVSAYGRWNRAEINGIFILI